MKNTKFLKTLRSLIARIITINANTESDMMALNCVLLMIQEFRLFGKLEIRGGKEQSQLIAYLCSKR